VVVVKFIQDRAAQREWLNPKDDQYVGEIPPPRKKNKPVVTTLTKPEPEPNTEPEPESNTESEPEPEALTIQA